MLTYTVLFVYNRDHTRKTVKALSNNLLINESELLIYSDTSRDVTATDKVQEFRTFIKTIQGCKSLLRLLNGIKIWDWPRL
jgi:hypothetical protein